MRSQKTLLKYDPALDASHQIAMLKASVPLVHTGEDQIGWMRAEVWEGMHDFVVEQGLLTTQCDVSQVYSLEFLENVYGE